MGSREFQLLVPAALVPAPLQTPGLSAPRVGASDGNGQSASHSTASGPAHHRPISSRQTTPPIARQTQTRPGALGHDRRSGHLYPFGFGPRPGQPVGPNLPDWPTTQVHLRQNRPGYPTPAPDGLPGRKDLQALALQIEPTLTSRICTMSWRWSQSVSARSCGGTDQSKSDPRSLGGSHLFPGALGPD